MNQLKKNYSYFAKLNFFIRSNTQSNFGKNLISLGLGTGIAQLIPIIVSPILTRLFAPEFFGLFTTFSAVLSILLVFNSGKYELALLLPKYDKDAINIIILCIFLLAGFSLILEFVFLIFSNTIVKIQALKPLINIFWIIPIAAFLAGLYNVINEWYIRRGYFKGLGFNKIGNTSGISGTSIILGLFQIKFGLILGQVGGQIFSVFWSIKRLIKSDSSLLNFVTRKKILFFSKKYINFSKFIIPAQLLNSIASQLPVFFLTSNFGIAQAGFYGLTDRVLGVPLSFVGNAFKDVFKQRAALDLKEKGNCYDIYKKITLSLAGLAFIPFLLLFFISPFLFAFIFGNEWRQSGIFAQ